MEDQVGQSVTDSGEHAGRVVRVRKRRRSNPNKKRPWYKSKRLRYRLEVFGKMFLVSLFLVAFTAIAYLLTITEN